MQHAHSIISIDREERLDEKLKNTVENLIVNKEWFSTCLGIKLENDKIKMERAEHRIAKASRKKFTNLL